MMFLFDNPIYGFSNSEVYTLGRLEDNNNGLWSIMAMTIYNEKEERNS